MDETIKGYSILEWLMGSTIIGLAIKELWKKYQKNQDKIDDSVIETVKEVKARQIQQDKELQAAEFRLRNAESRIDNLHEAWRENNDSLKILNETIKKFDDNMKVYHRDMSTLVAEAKQSMDNSNKVTQELIGYMRGKDK